MKRRLCTCVMFLIAFFLLTRSPVHSQEYTSEYNFDFYPENNGEMNVKMTVTLTQLRADVYMKEFSVTFPNSFFSKKIKATNFVGDKVPFNVTSYETSKKITFNFDEPLDGKYSENVIILEYPIKQVFINKGTITEVILPLIAKNEDSTVNVALHLPIDFEKKISISKPVPTSIDLHTIYWKNVDVQTIYTVFGESQIYDVSLAYNLKNDGILDKTMEIALPPETLYQKIYLTHLKPEPDATRLDYDDNFIAQYVLGPKENLNIKYKAHIEVYTKPQNIMRDYVGKKFQSQKNYLLSEKKYWTLGSSLSRIDVENISSAETIYSFITSEFTYSYDRAEEKYNRFGAQKALEKPHDALCTDYTDTFVSLAREHGIFSREIIGYGYSEIKEIRPQSFVRDSLHAWPEYYVPDQNIWIQVDPTWEDTSNIDYFKGFDVNHIAFVVHGKDSETPKPAGFYGNENAKDIRVDISSEEPKKSLKFSLLPKFPDKVVKGMWNTGKITLRNDGNMYAHKIAIALESDDFEFKHSFIEVDILQPYGETTTDVTFKSKGTTYDNGEIRFSYKNTILNRVSISITSSVDSILQTSAGVIVGAILFVLVLLLYVSRR